MSYTIAIAGKGGTGKTTIAALILKALKERKTGSILAVDADPNNNLGEALGIKVEETVGSVIDQIAVHPENVPAGMSKDRFIDYKVQTIIKETEGFDLLTMGTPEGPGCYCYANNILRETISKISRDYDFVIIDNEAGLEHFSRRTTRYADILIIVSDNSKIGIKSALRIKNLIHELKIKVKKTGLLINRSKRNNESCDFTHTDLDLLGVIPEDETISMLSTDGVSLFNLSNQAPGMRAIEKIGEYIWQEK